MADPLSTAASIAGLATLGFAIAKGLYQIANGIGSAGEDVRIYGDEVAIFSKLIYHVRSKILHSAGVSSELQSLLDDTVSLCDRVLHPFQRILATLTPLLTRFRGSGAKMQQFGLRLQWVFRTKDKLLFYRRALATQQRMLQTLLDLIILQTTEDKSTENVKILNISLEHSVSAAKAAAYPSKESRASGMEPDENEDYESTVPRIAGTEPDNALIEDSTSNVQGEEEEDLYTQPLLDDASPAEDDTIPSVAVTLYYPEGDGESPIKGGDDATDTKEMQEIVDQIDHDLDPDNSRTILAIVEDLRILCPRIISRAAQELKANCLGLNFVESLHELESSNLETPLAEVRPARYRQVHVLLLHWETDDLFVLPELDDLEKVFRVEYGYETDTYPIPSKHPQRALTEKVVKWLDALHSSGSLLIVYYAGHARIDEARQSTWSATRQSNSPWLRWSSIQTLFEEVLTDILILLDCSAGAAGAQYWKGANMVETIAASAWDAISPEPGRYSFTNCVIDVLEEWKGQAFSAAMLHSEVLVRLKHPRPIRINGKRFETRSTPVHIVMTSNFRIPSIEISALPLRKDPTKSSEKDPANSAGYNSDQSHHFIPIRSR